MQFQHLIILNSFKTLKKYTWGNNFLKARHTFFGSILFNLSNRLIFKKPDGIIGYSPSRKNFPSYIKRFYESVNLSEFALKQIQYESPLTRDVSCYKNKIFFIGAIKEGKNLENLCKTIVQMNKYKEIKLDIYGTGPLKKKLETIYGEKEFINFKGFFDMQDLKNIKDEYDFLIMPGLGGLIPLDALVMQIPCVASGGDGTIEYWFGEKKYGYLIPTEKDNNNLEKAIKSFYSTSFKQNKINTENASKEFIKIAQQDNFIKVLERIL